LVECVWLAQPVAAGQGAALLQAGVRSDLPAFSQ